MHRLLPIAALFFCLACSSPSVVPTRPEMPFQLTELKGAAVAVWPIVKVDLEGSVPQTVEKEYQSQAKFNAQLTERLGAAILANVKPGSLGPSSVIQAFKAQEVRDLLEPTIKMDATKMDSGLGFTEEGLAAYIRKLKAQPALKETAFVILPHHLDISRGWSTSAAAAGPGSTTSAETTARLRIVIIDLPKGKVVWEGKVIAAEESTFMKVKALRDAEKKIVNSFAHAILGRKDTL